MKEFIQPALAVQVRREFWEHRSLWIAPLAAAALLVVGSGFGSLRQGVQWSAANVNVGHPMIIYGAAIATAAFLGVVAAVVIFTYLLDCLFAERKDRSILFWKSLPVSDTRTVLVKLAVALLLVPLGVWLLGAVTHLAASALMLARGVDFSEISGQGFASAVLAAQGRLLSGLVFAALWYAPVATWLMLASVTARRAPLLMANLPLIVPALAERMLLGTSELGRFIGRRLLPSDELFPLIMNPERNPLLWAARPDLWLGLVVAAGMLYLVIRLRRYRDDT